MLAELNVYMNHFVESSKWVDRFEENLDSAGRLKDLWYYRRFLLDHVKEALESGGEGCRYLGVLFQLVEEFEAGISPQFAGPQFQAHLQSFAKELSSCISQRAAEFSHQVALEGVKLDSQILPSEAIAFLPREQQDAEKKIKGGKKALCDVGKTG
ncbi:hypothetical protein HDV05_007188, partial [Chytridiales sp. JEL 0842]